MAHGRRVAGRAIFYSGRHQINLVAKGVTRGVHRGVKARRSRRRRVRVR